MKQIILIGLLLVSFLVVACSPEPEVDTTPQVTEPVAGVDESASANVLDEELETDSLDQTEKELDTVTW